MPPPPLVTDYDTMGGASGPRWKSTWAGVRYPLALSSETQFTTSYETGFASAEYDKGFVAADGSLFRFDPVYSTTSRTATSADYGIDVGPPRVGVFVLSGGTTSPGTIQPVLDIEDLDQLKGELVTMTFGTFGINVDAYTNPPFRETVAPDLGNFTSIGKLYKF